jgi:uncharacterized membrane protein YfcA
MTVPEIAALTAAAFFAGAMNALAGGGTVLTFPALLAFGMPAIQANATSTLALVIGIVGSVFGYRRHMRAVAPLMLPFGVASAVGGLLGALLARTGDLLHRRGFWAACVFQFLVAIYGGYFGAGIGILMLATLGILGMHDIYEMNALKTVLGALVNIVAAAYFIYAGLIVWPEALVMTAGATLGYFSASHGSQRIRPEAVRRIAILIGLGISAWLLWKQFLR